MAQPDQRLLDGTAVVTGAGSGLGRALAQALASKGMRVAALGRRLEALEQTAAANEGIVPFTCDVSDPASLEQAFLELRRAFGPVTLLVNNAAVYPHRDVFLESQQSFMDTVATNLGGVFGATRLALDDMAKSGFGRILNVASFADISPLPSSSGYSVSKGAARVLTRALVADLADRFPDVVISDWLPGMLATDMGIPDGLAPDVAANWGVELALWHDPALTGSIFEMNVELLPPRSLKRRVKDLVLMQGPKPRLLGVS